MVFLSEIPLLSLSLSLSLSLPAHVCMWLCCKLINCPPGIYQAARALTNLAAHGDSNINNAATGQEAGALEAFVQLKRSPNKGVR